MRWALVVGIAVAMVTGIGAVAVGADAGVRVEEEKEVEEAEEAEEAEEEEEKMEEVEEGRESPLVLPELAITGWERGGSLP